MPEPALNLSYAAYGQMLVIHGMPFQCLLNICPNGAFSGG